MDVLGAVRVLDLSDGVAPSVTGMLLADFGADVVKVNGCRVPRHGRCPASRSGTAAALRDGGPGGRVGPGLAGRQCRRRRRLHPRRRAGAGRLGPAVAEAVAGNARLVLLRMPPYLPEGTPWLGGHESNALLSAHAGVSWRQSSDDGGPVEPVYQHLLHVQGAWATVCAVAGLLERERSGWGQEIVVSGMNGVMEATVYALSVDPNAPDPVTAVGGVGRHPTYRPVRAADAWLACGALGPKFEARLLHILGIAHILDDPRLGGRTENMVLPENLQWAMDQVSAAFATRPRDHWVQVLRAQGIPAGPLLERDDWLDHPQIVANGLRVGVDDPERGEVVMPGVPVTLTATPGRVRGPAPVLGQHNGAAPWPAQEQPHGLPPVSAGPLGAFRFLNLGTFVASPYAGFLLSELGADVVKVEPLTGDPFRGSAFTVNRGMRSLSIDLSTPEGAALLHRVVADVDAVIDGMRPGVMAKLGIGHEDLRRTKPDIVTMSLAAFGMHGDLAGGGGVDMVVQAMSGMMLAQGEEDRPVSNTIAILDVTTAALSTLATLLALYHRERTGEGQRAWDSLIGTSTFLASGELVRFAGRPPDVRGGPDFRGREPLDRYYAVSDGWVRVQATDPSAVTADDLKQAGLAVSEVTAGALAAVLAGLPAEQAVASFASVGVPAVLARRVSELFRDPALRASEFTHFRRADDGSTIATPGRYATFSRTQRQGPLTPPGVGEHTREVLEKAGLGALEVEAAVQAGVVTTGRRNPVSLGAIYR